MLSNNKLQLSLSVVFNRYNRLNVSGTCTCQPGFTGDNCDSACPPKTYGRDCMQTCECNWENTASCNPVTGECKCIEGWNGKRCHT